MKYSLLITAPPNDYLTHRRAIGFTEALLDANHLIQIIFFYGMSTSIGLASQVSTKNLNAPKSDWSSLAKKLDTKLTLCISSALHEGIVDEKEALRTGINSTVAVGFEIAGIGSLIGAIDESDRLVTFGG